LAEQDTKVYSADPLAHDPANITLLKHRLQFKTAAERRQWLEDGIAISREESAYRASALSAVNRMGPPPERTLREIQASRMQRAARFKGTKDKTSWPDNGYEFQQQGGMQAIETRAARNAAKRAIRFEQEYWLQQLETFLVEDRMLPEDVEFSFGSSVRQGINTHPNDMVADLTRAGIKREVKRLRRILGYRQGADDKRAKTRERVRKFRARQSPNPASRRI
jgi:hypothetical protein